MNYQNSAKFLFQFNFRHLFDSVSKVNLFFGELWTVFFWGIPRSQKGDLRSDLRLVKSFLQDHLKVQDQLVLLDHTSSLLHLALEVRRRMRSLQALFYWHGDLRTEFDTGSWGVGYTSPWVVYVAHSCRISSTSHCAEGWMIDSVGWRQVLSSLQTSLGVEGWTWSPSQLGFI